MEALQQTHLEVESAKRKLSVGCIELIAMFGKHNFFSYYPEKHTRDVERLIDLGLLRFDFNPATKEFAYHWTYLGNEVRGWVHKNWPTGKPPAQG